ncbi:periplasmic binding family protein [Rhodococcus sp. MTM3W5.2]|uniref:ABC transporter substrate-binding protein n=1 Tax=Rhodococcus sp. MTM3W5.2 TaxID=1805827 RepID=UPI00097979F4|nr:ABC transporter substrate-binding protein [Rhodococcus sp. MTM3W5.2]AQA20791.1 periplasmic binding family protein [Rhodococcus sp. MTM3W5.2]
MRFPRWASVLTSTLALTSVASLTACSSDDATHSASAGPDGAFPATVEHKFGSTTIESRPDRVVTVGFNDLDFALALGEAPVATRAFTGYDYKQRPWAQGYATDIPEVGGMELDVEKVAEADPDVLLGTYAVFTQDDYDTLSGLAPTVGDVRGPADGRAASWEDQLDAIGKALGKQGEAEKVRDQVRAAFGAATAANPQFAGRTAAVAMVLDNGFYILEPEDPRAAFFTTLGFTAPAETGTVSPERLDLLDQRTLIVLGATKEKLASDPVFSQLPVVKEDRTVYLGEFGTDATAALGFASPLSQPYLLDAATPALSAATDDDPATVVPAVG